jgi:hypothetical protein
LEDEEEQQVKLVEEGAAWKKAREQVNGKKRKVGAEKVEARASAECTVVEEWRAPGGMVAQYSSAGRRRVHGR